MKKQLPILLGIIAFLNVFFIVAQERELIKGQINVPEDIEVSGISIYNMNSLEGTITGNKGEFMLPVKLNDKLSFSSPQYQDFQVIVDKGVMQTKKINITISEAITELEEVVVRPYNLSGDVEVDLKRIKTKEANLAEFNSADVVAGYEHTFRPDEQSKVENIAMDKSYLTHGINFANIFKVIFKSYKKSDDSLKNKISEEKVREMANDTFFKERLGIEPENINAFLYYAESNGLDNEMIENSNNLDLIQFLIEQSKSFKAQQDN
ncbi:carboxypeptidase-like regulatory domain-containing protein [Haloflavibacter putidus]|uniref:CarboxypepD_reg-like domain-containing protein n=1 Tax=Haloflavibacter putidus TaxID=2576776 RepID=A0A507ZM27_9FLAO|nr:carboxypeptidase-like regulatory domain-containing protein [Haloflavibacter putidus]TQD37731.1 hypothetical protein FKR84_09670 [Haloflavibacter putidus]